MTIIDKYNKIRILDLCKEEIRIRNEINNGRYDTNPHELSHYTLVLASITKKRSDLLKRIGVQNAN